MDQQVTPHQALSNDDIRVLVHRKPACHVELEVTASPRLVDEAHKKAVKKVGKNVSLPSFRKGKAPDQLILKHFPSQIDQAWQEEIANVAFVQSEKLVNIPPLNRDSKVVFSIKKYSLDHGAELTFSFEVEPIVPIVNPKEFHKKAIERPVVNAEKVEETIRQAMFFFAEWKPVVDRPVKEGDFILLDVDVIEEIPPQRLFDDTRFEVVPKSMAKWMRDLVIGLNANHSVEGISNPDDDATPEDKETFKPKRVRLTVKKIEEATLPPLDDHFAKKLGVQTVDELREQIEKLLNVQAEGHVKETEREQASEFLLNHYQFDIPPSLVEREVHHRVQQLNQDSQFKSYWNTLSAEERQKTIHSIHSQAEKAVRMFYLCRKIISDQNISISPQDLPGPPKNFLEALMRPPSHIHPQEGNEMHMSEAFSRLVLEKAEDFVISSSGE